MCRFLVFMCSFKVLAADVSVNSEKVSIDRIISQAESATSPDTLFGVSDSALSIFYHLNNKDGLLKFSWYLVGSDETALSLVQNYQINTNRDRHEDEFKLHVLGQGKKALMIFLEMIKDENLLRRVKLMREELDLAIEDKFWQATDHRNPMLSLLPYSRNSYEDENKRIVVAYKPHFTQCKPLKFIKVQIFALANNMSHPGLKVGVSGYSRTISFRNHKIWPLENGSWLDVIAMLKDEKLTQSGSEYYELTTIDHNTYGIVDFTQSPNSAPASEAAEKYLDIHKYIGGNTKNIEVVKFCFAYVEAPFWSVAKKFAIRNATQKLRAQYQKRMDMVKNVGDGYAQHLAALPLMIDSITKNDVAMTMFAAILESNDIREHLFSMAKEGQAWASCAQYPFSHEETLNGGDYDYLNISPLSLLFITADDLMEEVKDSMPTELASRLSSLHKYRNEIFGSEVVADNEMPDKNIHYALAMALMAFSNPVLEASLNQDSRLTELLSQVTPEQKNMAAQLLKDIIEFRDRARGMTEKENARRIEANKHIDMHNATIDAQCDEIAKAIEKDFAL